MKFSSVLSLIASASLAIADDSLREAAKDFRIGVATDSNKFVNDAYIDAVNEFNYMVAENACKLSGIQPEKGVFNFEGCDAHYEKAVELGMKFRGHCLIWFNYQPQWFQDITDSEEMEKTIVEHITKVMTHYKGKIDTWDVVNEAIEDESTGENGTWELRDTFISRALPNFIDIAFKTAREVDPSVKLFYNDYDIEGIDIRKGMKTNAVYNFVKDMIDRGVPIDGVGLQYHLHTDKTVKYENVMETMKRFGDLGLEVQITEMDVNSVEGKTKESFELQGKLYGEGLQACLDSPNCTGFLIWGVGDSDSWRKDGYPLAFNDDYTPKPAYYAMLDVLKKYNNITDDDEIETENVDSANEDDINEDDANEDDVNEDSANEEDEVADADDVAVLDNNSDVEDEAEAEDEAESVAAEDNNNESEAEDENEDVINGEADNDDDNNEDENEINDIAVEDNDSEAENDEAENNTVEDNIEDDKEEDDNEADAIAAEDNNSEVEIENEDIVNDDLNDDLNDDNAEDNNSEIESIAVEDDIENENEDDLNNEAEDIFDENNNSEIEIEDPGFEPVEKPKKRVCVVRNNTN